MINFHEHCYVPLKKKKMCSNHNKVMTKKLRKEVMASPVCAIYIIKIAHTRTGQTIKSNVTFAQIF